MQCYKNTQKNSKESLYLWFDQNKIDKQHDKIMLDIFIRKALASRALRESHTFAQGAVVGFTVSCIETADRVSTLYADWHFANIHSLNNNARTVVTEKEVVNVDWGMFG